jgi:hypothetical protein
VLLVIADHADDEGTQSYPSQATIAAGHQYQSGLSRSREHFVRTGLYQDVQDTLAVLQIVEMTGDLIYIRSVSGRLRGDIVSGRTDVAIGATTTTSTGRQSRPKSHPLGPSLKHQSLMCFGRYIRERSQNSLHSEPLSQHSRAELEVILAGALQVCR